MSVYGRLKPGVTLEQAQADLATIAGRLRLSYPEAYPQTPAHRITVTSLKEELTGRARRTLLILFGAVGLVLALGGMKLLAVFVARLTPRAFEIGPDGFVLLFTLAISIAAGILFGTVPALRMRINLAPALNESSQASSGAQSNRLRSALVAAQVAISLILRRIHRFAALHNHPHRTVVVTGD